MTLNSEIINWVEYTICEKGMEIFPKSKSVCATYRLFCETIRTALLEGELNSFQEKILNSIMVNTNRQYGLSTKQISEICANFYIDRKWVKYMKAIELMKSVKWKLPDPRFKLF